jgi:type VI secretion system protein ImpH
LNVLTNNAENIDYLAEVIISHLLAEQKSDMSGISIRLLGIFRRFFSKDVEKIATRSNTLKEREWEVFLHREGFYDLLPESFFHTNSRKYFKDHAETIAEFSMHKKEEKGARQFFIPLEQEFYKHHINKEIFEQEFYFTPETIREFIDFYNLKALDLSKYQKAILFFIMPYVSLIAGNLCLAENCFEIILQEKVHFKTQFSPIVIANLEEVPDLNCVILGKNSSLGHDVIDGNPQLLIEIGPLMKSDSLLSFLYGMERKLIDWLVALFIQADLTTCVRILLNKQDESFILGEKNYESRLNYSTSL